MAFSMVTCVTYPESVRLGVRSIGSDKDVLFQRVVGGTETVNGFEFVQPAGVLPHPQP